MNTPCGRERSFAQAFSYQLSSLLLYVLLLAAASQLFAQGSTPLRDTPQAHSQLPAQVANRSAVMLGHYEASPRLRLTLALKPPHLAEEERFLADLADKKSPNFHHFLTAAQWNARFAPSAADEQAVVDWATSRGFTVAQRFPNRLLVDLEAPVSTIEGAFGVTINRYAVGQEVDFSNDREPVIPADIAHLLVSVQGLNNIQHMHAMHVGAKEARGVDFQAGPALQLAGNLHRDGTASPASKGISTAPRPNVTSGFYDPADIWSSQAYDYTALQNLGHCCNPTHSSDGSPAASSIAIAAFQDFTSSDLLGFASQYNLALNVDRFYIDGNPGCCGSEVTADIEFSAAMSNSFGSYLDTAHIYAYEGGNSNNSTFTDMYNQMLTDGKARVFTTSWSCTEFDGCDGGTMDSRHNIFNQMVGQGWTLMAASGDRGATDSCSDDLSVAYPGSDPNFISVGGTTLQAAYAYSSETAWQGGTYANACSRDNNGGSGGGCSAKFAAPGYQTNPLCGSGSRSVPDISLNSSIGENFFYNGSLQSFAGTSMASPELAGFFAQNNAYLLAIGTGCGSGYGSVCAPVGNGNYYLYQEGNNPNYAPHYPFYDITSGCNSNDVTAFYGLSAFCAGTGYDAVTGWGSANMLQLAWAVGTYLAWDGGAPAMNFTGPPTSGWTNNSGQNVVFNLYDTSNFGYPATGVAGYTAQWDADPGDPRSEPTPGAGNPFYSGPAVVTTGGYGSLLTASLSQGCHTAFVRAWDNTGISGLGTYGQVCLDTVAPSSTDINSPGANAYGWNRTPITVTLYASDPGAGSGTGSGIAARYFGLDTVCTPTNTANCSVYTGPFTINAEGHHTLYSFSRDNAGNASNAQITFPSLDRTAPVTSLALSGTGGGTAFTSAVRLTFSATDGASGTQTIFYALDGGPMTSYTGYLAVSTPGRHTVTFHSQDYAGNLEGPKSATFTITSPTTTTLTSNVNPATHGQAITLQATVTPSLASTATGSVVFKSSATILGTEPLSGGHASLTLSTLPVGHDSLSATYGGAAYEQASTGSLTETVRTTTSTNLATSLASASFGQSITLTATVKPGATTTPTGAVQFLSGSTILGTANLSSGRATLTLANLAVGKHALTAKYEGDTLDLASASSAVAETISAAHTTIAITSSRNPSVWGEQVIFTAVVRPAFAGTATGTVTFRSGSAVLGTATLNAGGATFSTTTLVPGKLNIIATYNGSPDFATSVSAALTETILEASTKVALAASPNPAAYKQTVRLTATVTSTTPGVPTGSVTFEDGATVLGSANLANHVAVFNTAALQAGTHGITAVYHGSADDAGSTSPALSVKVNPAATSTTLTSTPNPAAAGQNIAFTIRTTSAAGTPGGKVNLFEDGKLLATLTLNNGAATASFKILKSDTHSLQATYLAAGDFTTSSSAMLKQVVK